eukprot:TRINITY_DN535_c0_g2_i1.p1 TRINITY_DN535_c0_g2~~TRINITY_DN535_c0_g2_i1.p1  ORF type:complete len:269 (-),score=14.89 TRINITY_DN535_c0_g2_i1:253-1059(-)
MGKRKSIKKYCYPKPIRSLGRSNFQSWLSLDSRNYFLSKIGKCLTAIRRSPLYDAVFWWWASIVIICEVLRFTRLSEISVYLKLIQTAILLFIVTCTELNGIDVDVKSALCNWDFAFVIVNLIAHITAGGFLTVYFGTQNTTLQIVDNGVTYSIFFWGNVLSFYLPASSRGPTYKRGFLIFLILNSVRVLFQIFLGASVVALSSVDERLIFQDGEYVKWDTCRNILEENNFFRDWQRVRMATVIYLLAYYILKTFIFLETCFLVKLRS